MSARTKAAKRRAEKPVDSEIRRAARRAGIEPRDSVPAPPEQPLARTRSLFDQSHDVTADLFRDRLSNLLTGGLWTSAEDKDNADDRSCDPIAALLHLGSVQAKILAVVVAHHDSSLTNDFARGDWSLEHNGLSRADLVTALHALGSLLGDGRELLTDLMIYGDFRHPMERTEYLEEQAEEAKARAAGGES